MSLHEFFPLLQYAHRTNHSTETALLKVKQDLLMKVNERHVLLLVMTDLGATCDAAGQTTRFYRGSSLI